MYQSHSVTHGRSHSTLYISLILKYFSGVMISVLPSLVIFFSDYIPENCFSLTHQKNEFMIVGVLLFTQSPQTVPEVPDFYTFLNVYDHRNQLCKNHYLKVCG